MDGPPTTRGDTGVSTWSHAPADGNSASVASTLVSTCRDMAFMGAGTAAAAMALPIPFRIRHKTRSRRATTRGICEAYAKPFSRCTYPWVAVCCLNSQFRGIRTPAYVLLRNREANLRGAEASPDFAKLPRPAQVDGAAGQSGAVLQGATASRCYSASAKSRLGRSPTTRVSLAADRSPAVPAPPPGAGGFEQEYRPPPSASFKGLSADLALRSAVSVSAMTVTPSPVAPVTAEVIAV